MFFDPYALQSSIQHAILMGVVILFALVILGLIMSGIFMGLTGSWQIGRIIANIVLISVIFMGGIYGYGNYQSVPIISDLVVNINDMTNMITCNLNQVTNALN